MSTYEKTNIEKSRISPLVIAAITLVIIAVCGLGAFLLISAGGQGYEAVERRSFAALFMGSAEDEHAALAEVSKNIHNELTLTPTQALTDLIYPGMELSLDPSTLSTTVNVHGGLAYMNIGLLSSGADVLRAELWADDSRIAALLTDISEIFITQELGEVEESQPPLAEEDIIAVISAAADKYFELIGEIEAEKGVPLSLGGIDVSAEKYSVALDNAQLIELVEALIDAVYTSEAIVGYAAEYYEIDLKKEIDENRAEMIADLRESGVAFAMDVYTAGKEVVRRTITLENAEDMLVLDYANISKNGAYHGSFDVTAIDNDQTVKLSLSNTGTAKDSVYTGKITGELDMNTLEKYKAEITYSNVFMSENGLWRGDIQVEVPALAFSMKLSSEITEAGDESSFSGEVYVGSGKMLDLSGGCRVADGEAVSFPEANDGNSLMVDSLMNSDAITETESLRALQFMLDFVGHFSALQEAETRDFLGQIAGLYGDGITYGEVLDWTDEDTSNDYGDYDYYDHDDCDDPSHDHGYDDYWAELDAYWFENWWDGDYDPANPEFRAWFEEYYYSYIGEVFDWDDTELGQWYFPEYYGEYDYSEYYDILGEYYSEYYDEIFG